MNSVIKTMLESYSCKNLTAYENALKEIIQEVALLGLWRSKFFEKAAFYGGTALRIFYNLDRFSEDLGFSLLSPDLDFDLTPYNQAVEKELSAFGFNVTIEEKIKMHDSIIKAAIIKAETKQQLIKIDVPNTIYSPLHQKKSLKIKMEVDINPPGKFMTETKFLLQPIPFDVVLYQLPDLFASKIHAILCRNWKIRVKGRDWYDLIWYIARKTPVRITHLRERLIQTNTIESTQDFTKDDMFALLQDRINQIDFKEASKDVSPFIKDQEQLTLWSKTFFSELISGIDTL